MVRYTLGIFKIEKGQQYGDYLHIMYIKCNIFHSHFIILISWAILKSHEGALCSDWDPHPYWCSNLGNINTVLSSTVLRTICFSFLL